MGKTVKLIKVGDIVRSKAYPQIKEPVKRITKCGISGRTLYILKGGVKLFYCELEFVKNGSTN